MERAYGMSGTVCWVHAGVDECILNRHSVRGGFDGIAVPRDVIEEIVRCGVAAPSSKGARPWRLHVVSDRGSLGAIADLVLAARRAEAFVPKDPATGRPREGLVTSVAESAEVLKNVSVAIFVENLGAFSTSRRVVAQADPQWQEDALLGYGFELIGIGAAVENMWLAARTKGLEGTFMGDILIAEEEIKQHLHIDHDLVGALVLGSLHAAPEERAPGGADAADRVVWHGEGSAGTPLATPL